MRTRLILAAVAAIAGAVIAIALFAHVPAAIGPFDATASATPAWGGRTVIGVPPLGTIGLDTHAGFVEVDVTIDELRLSEAESIVRDTGQLEGLENEVADDVRAAVIHLVIRTMLVAILGGILGALIAWPTWRGAVTGAAVAGVLTAAVIGIGAASFDENAAAQPEFTGVLAVAPAAIGDVEDIITRFGEYRVQLADLVANLSALYSAAQALPTFDAGSGLIRVLHVSDIHNNPQAFDLIERLIPQFKIQAVLDTGDITDWGSEPESQFLERIGRLDVPYVYVRGNHDSRQTQAAVAAQDQAVVLDATGADVAGLHLWGIGDPRYTPDKQRDATANENADAFAPTVALRLRAYERSSGQVDVLMVHDARTAADSGDLVPLVLAGHTHKAKQDEIGDSLVLVEGSTGGAGLRGLQSDAPVPLAASVLYFDRATKRLLAYDRVTIDGIGEAGARIRRTVIEPQPQPQQQPGAGVPSTRP